MTKLETAEILKIIKAEWPNRFKDLGKSEQMDILNLWAEMFRSDDFLLVASSVKSIIAAGEREFAPNVGTIKEQMRKLTAKDDMSEAEAWARIRKAISNSVYNSQSEFDKLPKLCKAVVGTPSQLREWAVMDSEAVQSVVASNVQRAYKVIQKREQESAKVPPDIKARFAESFAFRLDAPEDEPKKALPEAAASPTAEDESPALSSPVLRLKALADELRGGKKPSEQELAEAEAKKKAAMKAFADGMAAREAAAI